MMPNAPQADFVVFGSLYTEKSVWKECNVGIWNLPIAEVRHPIQPKRSVFLQNSRFGRAEQPYSKESPCCYIAAVKTSSLRRKSDALFIGSVGTCTYARDIGALAVAQSSVHGHDNRQYVFFACKKLYTFWKIDEFIQNLALSPKVDFELDAVQEWAEFSCAMHVPFFMLPVSVTDQRIRRRRWDRLKKNHRHHRRQFEGTRSSKVCENMHLWYRHARRTFLMSTCSVRHSLHRFLEAVARPNIPSICGRFLLPVVVNCVDNYQEAVFSVPLTAFMFDYQPPASVLVLGVRDGTNVSIYFTLSSRIYWILHVHALLAR